MKILFITLSIVISFSSYSQTSHVYLNSGKADYNWRICSKDPFDRKGINREMSAQTFLQFDSVRELNEINDTANADSYPWLSPDGMRLYFIRGAGGSGLANQLMFAERNNANSFFSIPVVVPLGISNPNSCWFSNDELSVYVCKEDSFFYAVRSSSSAPFSSPIFISLTGSPSLRFIGGPSLNIVQDRLYLAVDTSLTNTINLVEFSRTSSTSFAYVRTLVPSAGYSTGTGVLSKDEFKYFFSAEYNGWKSMIYETSRATLNDSFDLSFSQQIQGINDTSLASFQPSMSDSSKWVVFVRSIGNYWQYNDLYIASKGITSSVFNQEANPFSCSISPNPTTGQFSISIPTDEAEISITDNLGKQVLKIYATQKVTNINIDNYGIYFVCVKTKAGTMTSKIIVTH